MMLKLKCFRENVGVLYYDVWKMVFDLRIPYQNLLLKCYCNIEYAEGLVEFSSYLLAMPIVKVQINEESKFGTQIFEEFSKQLINLLESCIIDDKKTIYLIILNLKFGDTIDIQIHGKNKTAELVKTPFYKNTGRKK